MREQWSHPRSRNKNPSFFEWEKKEWSTQVTFFPCPSPALLCFSFFLPWTWTFVVHYGGGEERNRKRASRARLFGGAHGHEHMPSNKCWRNRAGTGRLGGLAVLLPVRSRLVFFSLLGFLTIDFLSNLMDVIRVLKGETCLFSPQRSVRAPRESDRDSRASLQLQ
jgi:hypothetical protein